MTVMCWGNSEGIKGRCDAKCHNAAGPTCGCMCDGRYHGGARDGSLGARVEQHSDEVIALAKERCAAEGLTLKIPAGGKFVPAFGDLPLFDSLLKS